MAFKGSDNAENLYSDLTDSGYSQWQGLQKNCDTIFSVLTNPNSLSREEWAARVAPTGSAERSATERPGTPALVEEKGYDIFVTGHSLGGGMAQTAALHYGISGFTQNALPIPKPALQDREFGFGGIGLNSALDKFVNRDCKLRATIVEGDIATKYYNGLWKEQYIHTSEIRIPYPRGHAPPTESPTALQRIGGTLADEPAATQALQRKHSFETGHAQRSRSAVPQPRKPAIEPGRRARANQVPEPPGTGREEKRHWSQPPLINS
jgi:Lipase (class 3)